MSTNEPAKTKLKQSISAKHLKPIQSLEKYSNATLFDRKEKELKEAMMKKSQLLAPIDKRLSKKTPIYLTENPLSTKNTKETSNPSVAGTARTNMANLNPLSQLNDIMLERKKAKEKSKDKDEDKSKDKDIDTCLDKKIKAMHIGKMPSVKEFINKTRDIVLAKYTTNIKKERAIRLQETYENELQSIEETVNALKKAEQLFNDNFFIKFGEYVKFLASKKEIEKDKDNELIDRITVLNLQIINLQNKCAKIKNDKAGLDKWMYFQIQIKEKKTVLPTYYKKIFNSNIMTTFITTIIDKAAFSRDTTKVKRSTNKQPTINAIKEIDPDTSMNEKDINAKEKERILAYKTNPVYRNNSDIICELKKYEDDSLQAILNYNEKLVAVTELQREKELLSEELRREDQFLNAAIAAKVKQCQMLKEKHKKLQTEYNSIANSYKLPALKQTHSRSQADVRKSTRVKVIHSKLYYKVLDIYEEIKEKNLIKINSEDCFFMKKNNELSDEIEIMSMLSYLEKVQINLGERHKYHMKINPERLIKSEKDIDKRHKEDKARKTKEQAAQKLEILNKKIQERNNKTYFLPIKKVDARYSYLTKKHMKNEQNKSCGELKFEDLMYDVDESI